MKFKNLNFTIVKIKFLSSFEDVYIDNILISSMISSSEKNYQCFIGYKYDDDYKIKPLRIMLP